MRLAFQQGEGKSIEGKKIVPDERRRPNTEERMMNDCSIFVQGRIMGGNITRLHNYWLHRQANYWLHRQAN